MLSPDEVTDYILSELIKAVNNQRPFSNECKEVKVNTLNIHSSGYVLTNTVAAFASKIKNQILVSNVTEVAVEGPTYSEEKCFINKTDHTHARWHVTTS
jgi:hypothetical protein